MTMLAPDLPRLEIDGARASAEQLRAVVLSSYGHFTAMQVRGRKVRGLDLHLARLDTANRELFGAGLNAAVVRENIRHALADDVDDASVRVTVIESARAPAIIVTVRPPGRMQEGTNGAWSLQSAPYQRTLPHIKRASDFGQAYYQRLAHASGFDEALLTGPGGVISEGSITNIGFFDGTQISWPSAPFLHGITMQLIERGLTGQGLRAHRAEVRMSDLGSFAGAFVTNSRGIAPVCRVDDRDLPASPELITTLRAVYDSAGWEEF
jgi:branched-subunit amino acid aminotransferase/4-amino-4-deoxychorismate lyase